LPAGSIAITAEPTEVAAVSLVASRPGRNTDEAIAQIRVEYRGGRLEISGPKQGLRRGGHGLDLTVRVPAGSRCIVRTASCDVACLGEVASLDVRTASGDVTAALVSGPVRVVTASGDVWLEEAAGEVAVNTASGDFRLLRAGDDVNVTTASGNVQISSCGGSVNARTASGDIRIDSIGSGRAELNCVSGDATLGVAPGVGVYLDISSLSGRVSSELEPADGEGSADLTVKCRSISGDVNVNRAVPAQAR